MTTTELPTTATPAASTKTRRRLFRVAAIGGTALATGTTFAVTHAFGVEFAITDPGPSQLPHFFSMPEIMILTVVIGLAGWGTLALLERISRHGRAIWAVLGAVVLLLSYVPIGMETATGGTRIMLGVIHTLVAVGLFTMLRRR
ncbi:DUF6069 family protein [Fodinicola feengrottensis]|uniref:DUF998 domain-containing protein n=1 Tax=Fodinicola feengrottensis TaxID=435914 RepID=A0ABN2GQP3_9ACTN|nr:DUF6069 family protein [Fodinicola feengrottensis]